MFSFILIAKENYLLIKYFKKIKLLKSHTLVFLHIVKKLALKKNILKKILKKL